MMREPFDKASGIVPYTIRDTIETAKSYEELGWHDMAETLYKSELEDLPQSIDLMQELAHFYARRGRDEDALTYFKRAFQTEPTSQRAIMHFANFLSTTGKNQPSRYNTAEALYARMMSINGPSDLKLLCALGDLYQKSGKIDNAAACFGRAAALPNADSYALRRSREAERLGGAVYTPEGWDFVRRRLSGLAVQQKLAPIAAAPTAGP